MQKIIRLEQIEVQASANGQYPARTLFRVTHRSGAIEPSLGKILTEDDMIAYMDKGYRVHVSIARYHGAFFGLYGDLMVRRTLRSKPEPLVKVNHVPGNRAPTRTAIAGKVTRLFEDVIPDNDVLSTRDPEKLFKGSARVRFKGKGDHI